MQGHAWETGDTSRHKGTQGTEEDTKEHKETQGIQEETGDTRGQATQETQGTPEKRGHKGTRRDTWGQRGHNAHRGKKETGGNKGTQGTEGDAWDTRGHRMTQWDTRRKDRKVNL